MPFRPQESLLSVNLEKMHTIDTRSVEDLFGLWTLFSRSSNAIEDGKRLENMSWRLWNRETFCCCPDSKRQPRSSVSSVREVPVRALGSTPRLPDLASSVDTLASDDLDATVVDAESSPPTHLVRPELVRLDSIDRRSRGSQKHMTSVDLENLIGNIKHTSALEPIENLPLPTLSQACVPELLSTESSRQASEQPSLVMSTRAQDLPIRSAPAEASATTIDSSDCDSSPIPSAASDTSSTTAGTHNVVRGFIPGGVPSSYRSQTQLATLPTPILRSSSRHLSARAKGKGATFTFGASSGEEESSLESHLCKSSISSIPEGPNKGLHKGLQKQVARKQASFRESNLISQIEDSPVFESDESDEDDEDVSDGVIDDDDGEDSSDWEDELNEDDRSEVSEVPRFQRQDSRTALVSHRSMLTSLMHEGDRSKALQNAASRSVPAIRRTQTTPPESSSRAPSPPRERNGPEGHQVNGALPISMSAVRLTNNLALSPRTTRRNMLSTELTESLRKNLLWERQQKSAQSTALKRRHTSHDVKNLKQYPDAQPHLAANQNADKFTNDYFHAGLGEYHSKGW